MATTRIKIPQLSDGTAGQLITWDASGIPTTVATGTSGHVLTSNGDGAAPTFQALTTITASNGLTKTGNDIALGGSLTGNTTITTTSAFALNVATNRAGAANAGFIVTNNSTGSALKGVASGTGTGYGVWGTSADNYAIRGESVGIASGAFFTIDAVNNSILNGLIVDRQVSGTSAANGLGVSLDFNLESSTTISQQANTLISKWTNATHGSLVSEFSITGVNASVASTLFTLGGDGKLKLNKYGVNSFTGTATYALHVDASGNVIEGSLSGGVPTTIAVTNDTLTGGSVYPVWTSGASGSQALKISATNINFVPSTGVLTAAGGFVGDLTGNVTGTADNVTGIVAIANGGTGQTTAANAINALVPSQTGNSGKYLTTNGTVVSWGTITAGDVLIGGNSPGADMSIGTNDTFGLNLETNGTTRISMTNVGVINIGQGAAQRVTVSSTASSTSGGIELSSTSTTAGTDIGVKVTGGAFTAASNDNKVMQLTASYTRASGASGAITMMAVNPTVNLSGSAAGSVVGIDITPTITNLVAANFYGLYMNYSDARAYGIFQNGANTLNVLQGKTAIGSTTAPTETLNVTGNSAISGQAYSGDFAITDGAGFTVNWNNGNTQYVTIQANRTPTFSNPKNGSTYRLRIIQGTGGSKLITWPTITWRGGTAPTLTTTAGKQDIIVLVYSNGTYFGDASLNY